MIQSLKKLAFRALTGMTWQLEASLSKWNIRAMKGFAWNMDMHRKISTSSVLTSNLHLPFCSAITSVFVCFVLMLTSHRGDIYIAAIHFSPRWDWGPTVTSAVQTYSGSSPQSIETEQTKEGRGKITLAAYWLQSYIQRETGRGLCDFTEEAWYWRLNIKDGSFLFFLHIIESSNYRIT